MTVRIGVLAPMSSELRPVVRRLGLRRVPEAGGRAVGRRGSVELVAATTGVGPAAAGAAARRLMDDDTEVDHVVVVGAAGGIAEGQAIGDVVAVDRVIDARTGAEYRPHPLAADTGGGPPEGALYTSDELIVEADRIDALRARGIVALDMETAAVAAVCEERGCAWSVVRAISDRFGDGLADRAVFELARPDGSPDLPAVARYVALDPRRIARLVRLAGDMRTATRAAAAALADALDGGGHTTGDLPPPNPAPPQATPPSP